MTSTSAARLTRALTLVRTFRIRELQDCLESLGIRPKTGVKAVLTDRIISYLNAEHTRGQQQGTMRAFDHAIDVVEELYEAMTSERATRASFFHPIPAAVAPAPAPAAAWAPQRPPPPPPPTSAPHAVAPHQSSTQTPGSSVPGTGGSQRAAQQPGVQLHTLYPQPVSVQLSRPAGNGGLVLGGGTAGPSNTAVPGLHGGTPPGLGPRPGAGASTPLRSPLAGVLRCVCNSSVLQPDLLACARCGVRQHSGCMLPSTWGGAPPPRPHHCERCRVELSDPFWEPTDYSIMLPGKMVNTGKTAMVSTRLEPVQFLERSFTLTNAQYDLIKRHPNTHRLLLCCMQMEDGVPFRQHWPMGADVRVNGVQYRVYARSTSTKMGANQRDEPANIGVMVMPGRTNRVVVQGVESSAYMLTMVLARARTLAEVKALMKPPDSLEAAAQRIRSELGGDRRKGGGSGSDDDDLQVTHTRVSLSCPLSGVRMKTPARFSDVPGLSCFDLDAFLTMVSRSRKWQCPNSMSNSSVAALQVDTFMADILRAVADAPDVTEVEIDITARWRPASASPEMPWHQPGEQLRVPAAALAIKPEPGKDGDGGSSEEDEDEELRKAVAAVKRGRPAAEPEVINLADSDDEVGPLAPPPVKHTQPPHAARGVGGRNGLTSPGVPAPPHGAVRSHHDPFATYYAAARQGAVVGNGGPGPAAPSLPRAGSGAGSEVTSARREPGFGGAGPGGGGGAAAASTAFRVRVAASSPSGPSSGVQRAPMAMPGGALAQPPGLLPSALAASGRHDPVAAPMDALAWSPAVAQPQRGHGGQQGSIGGRANGASAEWRPAPRSGGGVTEVIELD